MKRREIYPVAVLMMLALYVVFGSIGLGIGTLKMPGPGFFPVIGAVMVLVSGAYIFYGTLCKAETAQGERGEPLRWWSVTAVLLAIVVFALLVEFLGFFICTFLMIVFFQRVVSSQPWPKSLIVGASTMAGSYILFEIILNAQLPMGFLAF